MPDQLEAAPAGGRGAALELLLCGTGMRLGQMTLETLQALRRCSRVFAVNLPRELLAQARRVVGPLEDLSARWPRGLGFSEAKLCKALFSRSGAKGRAGVLFFGHPLLHSAGPELIRRCRESARPYRILAGLSSVDAVLASAEGLLGAEDLDLYGGGLAVLGAPEFLRRGLSLDPRCSALILNLFRVRGPRAWSRLAKRLKRCYGPRHRALLIGCGPAPAQDSSRLLTLARLCAEARVSSEETLFIPARR